MIFRLLISEDARLDLLEAILWYEDIQAGLGFDFEQSLTAAFTTINNNPLAFEQRYKQIRIYFLDRFPYGIHYLVEGTTIYIIAIFHTSRKPTNWNSRL